MEGGKIGGHFIKGKNSTNFKVHLRSAHKEANLAYLNKIKENTKPPFPERDREHYRRAFTGDPIAAG